MAMRKREDEVFPNAAGIDIGASSHWVAVPRHLAEESVREFGAMTDDLNALADWLLACGVDTVALESTGVYWIPVYEVLKQRGLKVWLVDARQMKYVPGRKSDVQDCQWLQKLMSLGLLRAAWRPDGGVCVVRAVARQREVLITEQASWVQRMQKSLVQMNIQLTEVLSDVMGVTGQAIIRAIVARPARPAGAGSPPPQSRQGQRPRDRQGADWQLARRAPVCAVSGAGDVRRHCQALDRVRCQAAIAAGRTRRMPGGPGQGTEGWRQVARRVRRPPGAGQLGWRRSQAHQRAGRDGGDEAARAESAPT